MLRFFPCWQPYVALRYIYSNIFIMLITYSKILLFFIMFIFYHSSIFWKMLILTWYSLIFSQMQNVTELDNDAYITAIKHWIELVIVSAIFITLPFFFIESHSLVDIELDIYIYIYIYNDTYITAMKHRAYNCEYNWHPSS